MIGAGRSKLSPDELISTIKKSKLPTVVVEGDDDIIIFRRLEEVLSEYRVSVIQAGGRSCLLKVFERLEEIPHRKMIAFIADRDTWVFSDVPERYQSDQIAFTDGYSIENDIYRDDVWRAMLVGHERERYQQDLDIFLYWYALAISRKLRNVDVDLSIYPKQIIDDHAGQKNYTRLEVGEVYPESLLEKISLEYGKLTRGHSLVNIWLLQTAAKGRVPQVNHRSLIEFSSARRGERLSKIYGEIEKIFRTSMGGET
jgi:hypothetical protein